MSFHCDYFGKGWEDNDPACDDCRRWVSCKRLTKEREQKKNLKKSKAVALASRIKYSYHTNPKYVLPAEGEPALRRIFFNALAGALSAIGGEIFAFFQEWRWPYTLPALPEKVEDEDVDAEEPSAQRVAKNMGVNCTDDYNDDDDDESDFDLDDL